MESLRRDRSDSKIPTIKLNQTVNLDKSDNGDLIEVKQIGLDPVSREYLKESNSLELLYQPSRRVMQKHKSYVIDTP